MGSFKYAVAYSGNTTIPSNTTSSTNVNATTIATNSTTPSPSNSTTLPSNSTKIPTNTTTTLDPAISNSTNSPSTQDPPSSEVKLGGAVIAIIVLVSLTVLVVIGVVIYKNCFKRQQTSPFYNL